MVTHSVRAASRAGRVLFIKDGGEVYHQLYRGNLTDDQLYQKITDALTVPAGRGASRHDTQALSAPCLAGASQKNKRLYLPFLLTCVGMVTMTSILLSLASSPHPQDLSGRSTMPMILGMGSFCHGGVRRAVPVLHEFLPLSAAGTASLAFTTFLGMGKGNLAKGSGMGKRSSWR